MYKEEHRKFTDVATHEKNLDTYKKALTKAESVLSSKINKKVLNKNVELREEMQYFKVQNIDKDLNKVGCDAASSLVAKECDEKQNEEEITRKFLIADAKYDEVKAEEDNVANVLKTAEDLVDAKTFAHITTCDASAGLVHKTYDGSKCEGTPEKSFTATWGACTKAPDGSYVKITGAAALKAAAVALVAFAGSQF